MRSGLAGLQAWPLRVLRGWARGAACPAAVRQLLRLCPGSVVKAPSGRSCDLVVLAASDQKRPLVCEGLRSG